MSNLKCPHFLCLMLCSFCKSAWINSQIRLTSESIKEIRFYALLILYFAKFSAKMNLRVRQGCQTNMTSKSFFLKLQAKPEQPFLSVSPNCKWKVRATGKENWMDPRKGSPAQGSSLMPEHRRSTQPQSFGRECLLLSDLVFLPRIKWRHQLINAGSTE